MTGFIIGLILGLILGLVIGAIIMALVSRKNRQGIETAYQDIKKKYEEVVK